jgi:hypothetical protein
MTSNYNLVEVLMKMNLYLFDYCYSYFDTSHRSACPAVVGTPLTVKYLEFQIFETRQ